MEIINKIDNTLFWRKYRPTNLKTTILLPNIRKYLENENGDPVVESNLLMVGRPGMGKTTVSKIIESKFDTFRINASKDMNMEALRNDVTDFCRTMDVMSDSPREKVVYLDEFDGVKPAVQEALRCFIEDYDQNVRFIATCNDISSINDAMLSRFTLLNFEPTTQDEVTYLMNKYAARLKTIATKEEISISNDDILNIVNKRFPDLRSMTMDLQYIKKIGVVNSSETFLDEDLYKLILSPIDTAKTYEIILTKYSLNVQSVLNSLGRNFATWIFTNHPNKSTAVAKSIPLLVKYSDMYKNCIDPVILACALIYELQNTFK